VSDKNLAALVGRLTIQPPGDMHAVADAVARFRGRRITLMSGDIAVTDPCGMWIRRETVDYIVYAADVPEEQQALTVFHELGHMLAGHQGRTAEELAVDLMPRLTRMPELVSYMLCDGASTEVLCRVGIYDAYAEAVEAEAETIATLLVRRSAQARREGNWTMRPGREQAVAKAAESLGRPWER
jgi:hypothetical protein